MKRARIFAWELIAKVFHACAMFAARRALRACSCYLCEATLLAGKVAGRPGAAASSWKPASSSRPGPTKGYRHE